MRARQFSLRFSGRGRCGNKGVERGGGQHFRGRVGEVHGHERGAVLFVEVEALNFVVRVDGDGVLLQYLLARALRAFGWKVILGTNLEVLTRIVARVDRVLVLARVRVQLAAVYFDGLECQRAVGELLVAAVLPLHYALGTPGPLGCEGCQRLCLIW